MANLDLKWLSLLPTLPFLLRAALVLLLPFLLPLHPWCEKGRRIEVGLDVANDLGGGDAGRLADGWGRCQWLDRWGMGQISIPKTPSRIGLAVEGVTEGVAGEAGDIAAAAAAARARARAWGGGRGFARDCRPFHETRVAEALIGDGDQRECTVCKTRCACDNDEVWAARHVQMPLPFRMWKAPPTSAPATCESDA